MRLVLIYAGLIAISKASPLFESSHQSSEIAESRWNVDTVSEDDSDRLRDVQNEIQTTASSSNEDDSDSRNEEEGDRSSATEDTTVVEEITPGTVDETKVDEAVRIGDRKEETEGEESEKDSKEGEMMTTTGQPPELPTAMAQMMGQLEIRLIDENNTQTHVESVIEPPPLSPITPYVRDDVHHETTPMTSQEDNAASTSTPNEGEEKSNIVSEYDDKWKKVEYVSDTVIDFESSTTPLPSKQRDEDSNEVSAASPDAELPSVTTTEEIHVETPTTLSPMDQVALQKIQSAIELGIAKKMPEGPFPDAVTDEDLPVIEGVNVDDEDDDPEPVEECLANRHQLSEEVVHRMEKQVERLSKMVRKLGKQQSQYCTQAGDEHSDRQLFTDTYSQCPIWREEKIVHYYKLMRITYCADYGKWPNGPKMVKTYGQYLPLFETLYAFQKQ